MAYNISVYHGVYVSALRKNNNSYNIIIMCVVQSNLFMYIIIMMMKLITVTVIVIPPESSGLNMQMTFFGKAYTCDDPHKHIIYEHNLHHAYYNFPVYVMISRICPFVRFFKYNIIIIYASVI